MVSGLQHFDLNSFLSPAFLVCFHGLKQKQMFTSAPLWRTVHFLQPRAFTPSLQSRSNRCSLILTLCFCHNGNSFPHSLSQHMSPWERLCPEVTSITACNGAIMGDAIWGNRIIWEGQGQIKPGNRILALHLVKLDLSIICWCLFDLL